jgi:hypothetical protein
MLHGIGSEELWGSTLMKSPKKNNQVPRIAFEQLPFGVVQLHGLQGDQFQATQHFSARPEDRCDA